MGCSPSKGKLLTGTTEVLGSKDALLAEANTNSACNSIGNAGSDFEKDKEDKNVKCLEEPCRLLKDLTLSSAKEAVVAENAETHEIQSTEVSNVETKLNVLTQEQEMKNGCKMSNKYTENTKNAKESDLSSVQSKINVTELNEKAKQDANICRNAGLSKYDALLDLLDQATRMQLSLRPMAAVLALRYEEVNHWLEELAEEGERILKDHEDQFVGSCPTNNQPDLSDSPSNLIEQVLQYETDKMKLLDDSNGGLGDSTLEEAVEYFASLSDMLSKKLKAKRVTEQRLVQVLARMEATKSHRKFGPEDSSLHSEDSGIGGENESLAGSERHHAHRGSYELNATTHALSNNPCHSQQHHMFSVKKEMFENKHVGNRMSVPVNWIENERRKDINWEKIKKIKLEQIHNNRQTTCHTTSNGKLKIEKGRPKHHIVFLESTEKKQPKRPQTAAASLTRRKTSLVHAKRQSRSMESLCYHHEDTKMSKKMSTQCQKMSKNDNGLEEFHPFHRSHLARRPSTEHNFRKEIGENNGKKIVWGMLKNKPISAGTSMLPPLPLPENEGRCSVKRLINTFSSGVPSQNVANFRDVRKPNVSIMTDRRKGQQVNHHDKSHVNSKIPSKQEDMEMESLPPPPPEVLMDDSFESSQKSTGNEGDTRLANRGHCSQRSSSVCFGPNSVEGTSQKLDLDPQKDEAESLYRQARKIIHLQHSSESPAKNGKKPAHMEKSVDGFGSHSLISHRASQACTESASHPQIQKLSSLTESQERVSRGSCSSKWEKNEKWSCKSKCVEDTKQSSSEAPSAFSQSSSSSQGVPKPFMETSPSWLPVSARGPQPFIRRTNPERNFGCNLSSKQSFTSSIILPPIARCGPHDGSQRSDAEPISEEKPVECLPLGSQSNCKDTSQVTQQLECADGGLEECDKVTNLLGHD